MDIPTDCPQRDERLGWTGDAQVFMKTACYLKDVRVFFKKWFRDIRAGQLEDGGIPYVIPDVLTETAEDGSVSDNHSATGWGDAAVICPWTLYLTHGDKRILEEQYDSMKAWIEYIRGRHRTEFFGIPGFIMGIGWPWMQGG